MEKKEEMRERKKNWKTKRGKIMNKRKTDMKERRDGGHWTGETNERRDGGKERTNYGKEKGKMMARKECKITERRGVKMMERRGRNVGKER